MESFFEVFFEAISTMSDLFPFSVLLHFPPEVYLSRGVGDLCPLLVRAWHGKEISCIQFLRGSRVRVTVRFCLWYVVDLVLSILNVFRPSQLPFRSLRLKFLCFQGPNLCLFVSEYCLCEEFL